jgi:hypothetical protein
MSIEYKVVSISIDKQVAANYKLSTIKVSANKQVVANYKL